MVHAIALGLMLSAGGAGWSTTPSTLPSTELPPEDAEAMEAWDTFVEYRVELDSLLPEDIDFAYPPPVVETKLPSTTESPPAGSSAPAGGGSASEPPPAPPPSVYAAGVEQWRDLVTLHFGPGNADAALRVMDCESHGLPTAQNRVSSAGGLFQHLDAFVGANAWRVGVEWYDKYDPIINIRVTASVVAEQGWRQWTCKP